MRAAIVQTDLPSEEKHSVSQTGFIVWLFVILSLYLISNGPIRMLETDGSCPDGNELVCRFYAPWKWAYNDTPLHTPLGMYLHLWDPAGFDKDGYAAHTR